MLALDQALEFDSGANAEFFAALPSSPGVFLLEMCSATAAPYLAQTADIRRAADRLLRSPDAASKRLNLRDVAARIRYRSTPSKFERSMTLYQQTRALFPQKYRDRLRLRPPALLKVNLRNNYPRCYVTRSLRADGGFYIGPFPSRRAAEGFNESVLDLFKIRRCKIKIRRDPTFPGCVYSEMKMCMAPCFAGCTDEEYQADVATLVAMLDTRGPALIDPLERNRELASEQLDFERAATLHKRIEKVRAALRPLPDIVRRVDDLDAVILQRGAAEKSVMVFPLIAGILTDPLVLNFAEASEPHSTEELLRQTLKPESAVAASRDSALRVRASEPVSQAPKSPQQMRETYGLRAAPPELREHLSLIARWFYSKPRDGEILFRQGDWPYRRMLRACARLLAPPEKPAVDTPSNSTAAADPQPSTEAQDASPTSNTDMPSPPPRGPSYN